MTRKTNFECAWRRGEGSVLEPNQVNSVGILLGDKSAGPFELQINWVKFEVPK